MKLLTKEIEKKFAEVGTQDGRPESEQKVIAKYFDPTGSMTWYAISYEPDRKMFFGYVTGTEFPEYGYFGLEQLEEIKVRWGLGIERDLHFGYDISIAEVKMVS